MEKYCKISERMEQAGITVSRGLSDEEFKKIEEIYGFTFPCELREFYSCGLPTGEQFPIWNDFSDENVKRISDMIEFPLDALRREVSDWFWLDSWGDQPESREEELAVFDSIAERAPKLIPIYSHRYVPVIDGVDDPPVISTVGRDTIIYGGNLSEYLQNEFLGGKLSTASAVNIPFWSEIIEKAANPVKKDKTINNNEDILAFYKATNSLHDGMVVFAEGFGDCMRVGVDVTSIEGSPRVEMIFRGVKSWRIKCGDEIFCSNVGFSDGTVIWANSQSLDFESLINRKCDYVKADSMEWVM